MAVDVEHLKGCKVAKAVFGLLFLLVGLVAVLADLKYLVLSIDKWSLVILLAGLFCFLKALGGSRCPVCRAH